MGVLRHVLQHMRIHNPLQGQEYTDQQEGQRDVSDTGHHTVIATRPP